MSDPQQPVQNSHQPPPYAAQQQNGYPSQPPHPQQPGQPDATPRNSPSNTPGRVGLILGLAGIAFSVVMLIVMPFVYEADNYGTISVVIGWVRMALIFAAALCALIFGLIGLRRTGVSLVSAGIATGIGIYGTASVLFSFLINTVWSSL